MNDKNEMTQSVAVFRNQRYDSVVVVGRYGDDENYTIGEDYVRISEWMTVEFKPLPREELTAAEMDALSELRAKTVEEFREKLNFIDGRMANLRALTGPVSP